MAPALIKQAAAPSPNRALATIFALVIVGGQVRVGDATNMQELADLGVTVIDLTNLEADDAADHSKFAQLVAVGPELGTVLGKGLGQSTAQRQQSAADTLGAILGAPIKIISGQSSRR
jgi:esterase/lipase superfamily enzyme